MEGRDENKRDWTIRPYTATDLGEIERIADRAWQNIFREYRKIHGDALFARLFPNHEMLKSRQLRDFLSKFPEQALVAEDQGRVIGFVTYALDQENRVGAISNNAVDPDLGLKGVGQTLYQAVFDRFRKAGMDYAKVTTGLDDAHAPARRAYQRAGFDIAREDVTYYRPLN